MILERMCFSLSSQIPGKCELWKNLRRNCIHFIISFMLLLNFCMIGLQKQKWYYDMLEFVGKST
jgi:hypothetical protein